MIQEPARRPFLGDDVLVVVDLETELPKFGWDVLNPLLISCIVPHSLAGLNPSQGEDAFSLWRGFSYTESQELLTNLSVTRRGISGCRHYMLSVNRDIQFESSEPFRVLESRMSSNTLSSIFYFLAPEQMYEG